MEAERGQDSRAELEDLAASRDTLHLICAVAREHRTTPRLWVAWVAPPAGRLLHVGPDTHRKTSSASWETVPEKPFEALTLQCASIAKRGPTPLLIVVLFDFIIPPS